MPCGFSPFQQRENADWIPVSAASAYRPGGELGNAVSFAEPTGSGDGVTDARRLQLK